MRQFFSFSATALLIFLFCSAMFFIACGKEEKTRSQQAKTPIVKLSDETTQMNSFLRTTNAICKKMNSKVSAIQKKGVIELTDYTKGATDIGSIQKISKRSLAEINRRGERTQRKVLKVQNQAYSLIQQQKVPVGQRENLRLWLENAKKAQLGDDVDTLSVKQLTAQEEKAAAERDLAKNRSDLYAQLIGISGCRSDWESMQKTGTSNGVRFSAQQQADINLNNVFNFYLNSVDQSEGNKTPVNKDAFIRKVIGANRLQLAKKIITISGASGGSPGSCYEKYALKNLNKVARKRKAMFRMLSEDNGQGAVVTVFGQKFSSTVLNLEVMLQGIAVPEKTASANDPLAEPMQVAARVAKSYRRGVWQACTAEALELSGLPAAG